MQKLATAPSLNVVKESIARYWFTTADKIGVDDNGQVFQDGEVMEGFFVRSIPGGFAFVYEDKE